LGSVRSRIVCAQDAKGQTNGGEPKVNLKICHLLWGRGATTGPTQTRKPGHSLSVGEHQVDVVKTAPRIFYSKTQKEKKADKGGAGEKGLWGGTYKPKRTFAKMGKIIEGGGVVPELWVKGGPRRRRPWRKISTKEKHNLETVKTKVRSEKG